MQFPDMLLLKSPLTLKYGETYNCLIEFEDETVQHYRETIPKPIEVDGVRLVAESTVPEQHWMQTPKIKVDVLMVTKGDNPKKGDWYYYKGKVYQILGVGSDRSYLCEFENVISSNHHRDIELLGVNNYDFSSEYCGLRKIIASTIQYKLYHTFEYKHVAGIIPLGNAADIINQTKDMNCIYHYYPGGRDLEGPEILYTEPFKSAISADEEGFEPIPVCDIDAKFDCDQDALLEELGMAPVR